MTREEWAHCQRKRWYRTKEDAEAAIVRLWVQTGGWGLEVYPCRFARPGWEHFHIGHPAWARRAA